MAKKIFTKINMFDIDQQIFMADENKDIKLIASPSIENVKDILFSLMETDNSVEEVEFNGNEKYIKAIGNGILNELVKKYSDRNVRILINGKILN